MFHFSLEMRSRSNSIRDVGPATSHSDDLDHGTSHNDNDGHSVQTSRQILSRWAPPASERHGRSRQTHGYSADRGKYYQWAFHRLSSSSRRKT